MTKIHDTSRMKFRRLLRSRKTLAFFAILGMVLFRLAGFLYDLCHIESIEDSEKAAGEQYTLVVNTFRRNDLLKKVLENYSTCESLESIHVVWSDQQNSPPDIYDTSFVQLPKNHAPVHFDIYDVDTLNNRFHPIPNLKTEAIFSVDDDLDISCDTLKFTFDVWRSSRRALVGFVPRMHSADPYTGKLSYLGWWNVWWNGAYSMILTKACFFHKDYLDMYTNTLSKEMLDYIHKGRNCEDIMMSFLVANATDSPSVWVKGNIREIGTTGISSANAHIEARSECMDVFTEYFGRNPLVVSRMKAEKADTLWFW